MQDEPVPASTTTVNPTSHSIPAFGALDAQMANPPSTHTYWNSVSSDSGYNSYRAIKGPLSYSTPANNDFYQNFMISSDVFMHPLYESGYGSGVQDNDLFGQQTYQTPLTTFPIGE
jgi:hypothetical protein